MYGANVTCQEILNGKVPVPESAPLLKEVAKYAKE
jgi:lipid-binding SYLF domain-containing protein